VCGRIGDDSLDSLMAIVSEVEVQGNRLTVCFHDGERAFVQTGAIGDVALTLNGKSVSGAIVLARVSGDGSAWFVLYGDGKRERQVPVQPKTR
jgi:hypothetical protein